MFLHERDPDQFAIVCEPAGVVYAQRPTRAEAELVLADHAHLIAHFGTPRIEVPKLVLLTKGDT